MIKHSGSWLCLYIYLITLCHLHILVHSHIIRIMVMYEQNSCVWSCTLFNISCNSVVFMEALRKAPHKSFHIGLQPEKYSHQWSGYYIIIQIDKSLSSVMLYWIFWISFQPWTPFHVLLSHCVFISIISIGIYWMSVNTAGTVNFPWG